MRKTQRHWVDSVDGDAVKHGTTYDWHYAYGGERNPAEAAAGRGTQPHAPTHIGTSDLENPTSDDITGRTFSYDANGNQLGWTDDKNANYRSISWDDENRIQSIQDNGKVSHYGYDAAGQRVIKQTRQNLTVYVNQYFTERNGSIGSKHIFVGNTRMVTKVTGGTLFIRSYDGVTGAKTPPGQANQEEKTNNGKAVGKGKDKDKDKDHSDNGKHLGQLKNADKANNGNGKGKAPDKPNGNANTPKQGSHPGQGIYRRSDRANEVAMNTCKNKHLIEEHCDADGNGVPDSQEGDGDSDGDGDADPAPEEIVQLGSQGEQLFYNHSDHLGSTGYVTRENGEVHEHIQYFPFGETWVQQGGNTEKSPYLFTSKELDEETGLYYFGTRYYDPRTSVWHRADPILSRYLNGSPNGRVFVPSNLGLYGYSEHNPVRFKDDDGEFVNFLFGAALGAGFDFAVQTALIITGHQDSLMARAC